MATTYYDDDGNPIEALSPEETQALQDKVTKLEELEKMLAEKEEENAKLKNKDNNFQRFREKTEEEKAKILEKATEKEKMVLRELDEITKERESEKKAQFESARSGLLQQLAGDDKDLQKSIELRAKEWGEPKNIEEMEKRYTDAKTLIVNQRPGVSPMNRWAPVTGYQTPTKEQKFVETPQGQDLYKRMFGNVPKL